MDDQSTNRVQLESDSIATQIVRAVMDHFGVRISDDLVSEALRKRVEALIPTADSDYRSTMEDCFEQLGVRTLSELTDRYERKLNAVIGYGDNLLTELKWLVEHYAEILPTIGPRAAITDYECHVPARKQRRDPVADLVDAGAGEHREEPRHIPAISEGEYKSRIDCLSMFVRRLYRKLRKHEPDAEVISQANTYLRAIGQAGTPLRAEECAPIATEIPSVTAAPNRGECSGPLPGRDVTVVRTPDKTLFVTRVDATGTAGEQGSDAETCPAKQPVRCPLGDHTGITVDRKGCAQMLRRGMLAIERQSWEVGETAEAWYHAAGTLAAALEAPNVQEPLAEIREAVGPLRAMLSKIAHPPNWVPDTCPIGVRFELPPGVQPTVGNLRNLVAAIDAALAEPIPDSGGKEQR